MDESQNNNNFGDKSASIIFFLIIFNDTSKRIIINAMIYLTGVPQSNLNYLSPYLNYEYLPPSQPEFLFPEGAVKQRGRFELAFSQIGAACIVGAGVGGANGFYKGLKATTLEGQKGALRRTQCV